ncbi:MAG: asparagine synthase (glutamine-hydrolyzing) [Phycisphaerales bacterium]|nr:asparagine synthase (glutamine-hydrolyzing) [Phycisphaerales bacterium]
MCGIAGIISRNPDTARPALARMLEAQRHRGPDDGGFDLYDATAPGGAPCHVGIGNRRLAIQDLSAAGHQPMVHPETGDALVFNGEIYNYPTLRRELEAEGLRFKGHSDTEGLLYGLAKYGIKYADKLAGMYAFAFFHKATRSLLIARDPIGIKPLYIAWTRDAFLFGSEIRAMLASEMLPRRLDRDAAVTMLAYGAVQEPRTIFQDITVFPAGCWQRFELDRGFDRGQYNPQRFWTFPPLRTNTSEKAVVEEFRATADLAVAEHMLSDVPVGVFLSAGLDSTIVASLAARHTSNLRTFTVGFADQPEMSEAALAGETARLIGATHTDVVINGPDALAAAVKWIESLDQPSVDGLNTYVISQAVRAHGIVVALSGLGGDELFGGYSSFRLVPAIQRRARQLSWLPGGIRRALANLAAWNRPPGPRAKLADMLTGDTGLVPLYLRERRLLSNAQLASLGIAAPVVAAGNSSRADYLLPGGLLDVQVGLADAPALISQLESRLYMGNTLLRDSDTNGMAHSLEIRVPVLDQRLLNFAYSVPGAIRVPAGKPPKHLMREAFADLLRRDLIEKKKTGFTLPVGRWMLGPIRELAESGIASAKSLDLFDSGGIEAIWRDFLAAGTGTHWTTPLSLVALGHYASRMKLPH